MSWVVPSLQQDFTTDLEDLVIAYIQSKWSLADPATTDIGFRPGFFDYTKTYEVCSLQTMTVTRREDIPHYIFVTDIPIYCRARRLNTDEDPTAPLAVLDLMEIEVRRIAFTYRTYDIPGIDQMVYDGFERIYNPTDDYAKSDWSSVTRLKVLYQKQNLLVP